nr:MAG TPA: hypothetical protein [Caudoviricetes sp.]
MLEFLDLKENNILTIDSDSDFRFNSILDVQIKNRVKRIGFTLLIGDTIATANDFKIFDFNT